MPIGFCNTEAVVYKKCGEKCNICCEMLIGVYVRVIEVWSMK